jgi:hypothetical protein
MTASESLVGYLVCYDLDVQKSGDNTRFKEGLLGNANVYNTCTGDNLLRLSPQVITNTMPDTTVFLGPRYGASPALVRNEVLRFASTLGVVVERLFILSTLDGTFDLFNRHTQVVAPVPLRLPMPALPFPWSSIAS